MIPRGSAGGSAAQHAYESQKRVSPPVGAGCGAAFASRDDSGPTSAASKASAGKVTCSYSIAQGEVQFIEVYDSPNAMDVHIGNCFPYYITMLPHADMAELNEFLDEEEIAEARQKSGGNSPLYVDAANVNSDLNLLKRSSKRFDSRMLQILDEYWRICTSSAASGTASRCPRKAYSSLLRRLMANIY